VKLANWRRNVDQALVTYKMYEPYREDGFPAMNSCATCRLNAMLWQRCLAMAFIL
jgi:hypothetical protein